MPTPLVTTRRVYFFRHCKQVTADKWAIVDVSIDKLESNIDERCYKRPSGCIIEDTLNGHIKVTFILYILFSTIRKLSTYLCVNEIFR